MMLPFFHSNILIIPSFSVKLEPPPQLAANSASLSPTYQVHHHYHSDKFQVIHEQCLIVAIGKKLINLVTRNDDNLEKYPTLISQTKKFI